ncbi:hypothetical protein MPTK1_4g00520 [Marchantia polymorpha subsp. ruderalis]|uniref:Bulb-type lectin domain-containing protein n=2 Tax=Marchantia polymorpha TaxID=3197 RepID=A0A176VSI3_MARPO|nr:hypothetical protein AXG93_745s1140 [Marchantia polymorpha subsp. ruderalis]PTQ36136.1 hypothetical protein MARPO_0066s0089 [Marchantia polymorpha]BBN07048.1 hypothetical protein Mp_4g00520 [Marchantia polymorpha subsp. ruderalis]|eukprot:PTQ36136.1 hypothetical protein MARPO_0066s0089 [Marchantia polymorpha]
MRYASMASSCQLACAIALLLFAGTACADYFPTTAGVFTVTNDASLEVRTRDGNTPRIIFIEGTQQFALEFLSTTGQKSGYGADATFYLALVIKPFTVSEAWIPVWSPNRDTPVHQNATFATEIGGGSVFLSLRDADGTLVWKSPGVYAGTSTDFGVELGAEGNLKFLDTFNATVWESWKEPTDTLLPGQTLLYPSSLASAVSSSNYSTGSYRFNAEVAGVTITSTTSSAPTWWKSVIPTNDTVYATQHTCLYDHDTFFSAADGVVVLTGTTVASTSVQDPTLCSQPEANSTSVIDPFPSSSPPYDGSETVTTDQFARLEPSGVLQVWSYSVASRVYLAVSGAQAPTA